METFREPLTKEEEADLLGRLTSSGDMEARNKLIEHNLRLVAHIAKKYQSGIWDLEDLISIGTIGLIKAINTFRPESGNRLVTYASKCIDNEILMHLRNEKKKNREVSLNEPIGVDKEGNSIHLMDVIEADSHDYTADYDLSSKLHWLYHNMEKVLTPAEFDLVKKRYGIFGEKEHTQRELAVTLGISRSYVSRMEKKCLQKLKAALYREHY